MAIGRLSSAEIDGVAYHTTYQYASALMHYEAYTSTPTNPMLSADGAGEHGDV